MIVVRYLCKEILATLLVVVVAVLLILITNQFVHYLNSAAAGGITVMTVVKLMLLQIPLFVAYILPIGFFLAVLLALGQMYVNQEMTVLTACGFSQARLFSIIIGLALPVSLLTAWLMFSIEPKVEWYRIKISRNAAAAFSVEKLFPKRFQNIIQSGWVMYAGGKSSETDALENVFLAKRFPATPDYPRGYWEIIKSDGMHQAFDEKNGYEFVHLSHGSIYRGMAGEKNYRIIHFDHSAMALDSIAIIPDEKMQASFMTMKQLWKNYNQSFNTQVEFNWRLSIPFSVLVLAMLAVPLSYLNPRQGRFAKLFYALLIYLIYTNLLFVSRSWAYSQKIGPVAGLWSIHALTLILALVLIAQRVGWKRFLSLGRVS